MCAQSPVCLGFLEAFRTFCASPQPELRVLVREASSVTTAFRLTTVIGALFHPESDEAPPCNGSSRSASPFQPHTKRPGTRESRLDVGWSR